MAGSSGRESLILAEKPQVASRDLAKVLGVTGRSDGALTSDRYVITWCIGHLVELREPHEYDPALEALATRQAADFAAAV